MIFTVFVVLLFTLGSCQSAPKFPETVSDGPSPIDSFFALQPGSTGVYRTIFHNASLLVYPDTFDEVLPAATGSGESGQFAVDESALRIFWINGNLLNWEANATLTLLSYDLMKHSVTLKWFNVPLHSTYGGDGAGDDPSELLPQCILHDSRSSGPTVFYMVSLAILGGDYYLHILKFTIGYLGDDFVVKVIGGAHFQTQYDIDNFNQGCVLNPDTKSILLTDELGKPYIDYQAYVQFDVGSWPPKLTESYKIPMYRAMVNYFVPKDADLASSYEFIGLSEQCGSVSSWNNWCVLAQEKKKKKNEHREGHNFVVLQNFSSSSTSVVPGQFAPFFQLADNPDTVFGIDRDSSHCEWKNSKRMKFDSDDMKVCLISMCPSEDWKIADVTPMGVDHSVSFGLFTGHVWACGTSNLPLYDPYVCSGHGYCVGYQTCQCDKGWVGNQCQKPG